MSIQLNNIPGYSAIAGRLNRAAEAVRSYTSTFGRWVKAHTPSKMLESPENRAVRDGGIQSTVGENGPSYSLRTSKGIVQRTTVQHYVDLAFRPLLRVLMSSNSQGDQGKTGQV